MVYRPAEEKTGLMKMIAEVKRWLKFFTEVPEPAKKNKGTIVWNG